jgi:NAD-dependent deacetylase
MQIPPTLATLLRNANKIAALTGAGVSAESGVATFRQAQTGLWAKYKPEDLATPEAFARNPKMVWEWYAHRRQVLSTVAPNPGHHALVAIEQRVPSFTLATQNVDGLHARAGSRNLIELHGNIVRSKCLAHGHLLETDAEHALGDTNVPPLCPQCGAQLRPDVVWFGEALPPGALEQAADAARDCDLFLCVGTSAVVYPAAQLPEIAKRAGAVVVEVNPETSAVAGYADFTLAAASGVALPALVRAAWGEPGL